MKLQEIAYSRSGDKGNTINVCIFPYEESDWEKLKEQVTVEAVREKVGSLVGGDIVRYELPGSFGLNFVMFDALDGGVSITLRIDPHGKFYQSLLLDIDVEP